MSEGGSCSAFATYYVGHVDQYAHATPDQIRAAVTAAPQPSQACCRSLRQYVNQVCDPLS
jgi:hypothetical protein